MAGILEIINDRVVGAILILLIGLLVGLIVNKLLNKFLQGIRLDKNIKKLGKNYSLEKRILKITTYLIYFFTIIFSLRQLGIVSITLYFVVGLILLLLGATILIGIKDFIPNFIAGLVLGRKNNWKKGKEIKFDGIEGKIEKLGLLELQIKTKKGEKIYVPNSLLTKSKDNFAK